MTYHKKQQLVHIVEIVLMVFSKRNMFALLKYILDHTCHSSFVMKQCRISIDWEIMIKQ